jgi:hypothetical protein
MKEWFKKRVTFSNQNVLEELLVSSQVDYNNFMRMEHSTFLELLHVFISTTGFQLTHVVQPHHSQCKRVAQQPCCTKNIRTVLILCNRLCKLSISTIQGQPVPQHALLRSMIDREWAP